MNLKISNMSKNYTPPKISLIRGAGIATILGSVIIGASVKAAPKADTFIKEQAPKVIKNLK